MSDTSGPVSPTSPPPATTTAQLLEANKQKRIYAREEFLHHNSSKEDRSHSHGSLKTGGDLSRSGVRGGGFRNDFNGKGMESDESGTTRRMSSPFSLNNVLTASLKIPVQMTTNLNDEIANMPYIEDQSSTSSSGEEGVLFGDFLGMLNMFFFIY